jgi:hypothetical protein
MTSTLTINFAVGQAMKHLQQIGSRLCAAMLLGAFAAGSVQAQTAPAPKKTAAQLVQEYQERQRQLAAKQPPAPAPAPPPAACELDLLGVCADTAKPRR